jgi:hypothetical protein
MKGEHVGAGMKRTVFRNLWFPYLLVLPRHGPAALPGVDSPAAPLVEHRSPARGAVHLWLELISLALDDHQYPGQAGGRHRPGGADPPHPSPAYSTWATYGSPG